MNTIVALWAHPRSLSTAFERIFIERGDFTVFHEPFSYCRFMGNDETGIPHKHPDPAHPTTYAGVRDMILGESARKKVFHKDMCYHCLSDLLGDSEFLLGQINTFIVRDPAKAILSHAEIFPAMERDAIGYEALYRTFDSIAQRTGRAPIVVNADDLESHPEEVFRLYCAHIEIEFLPSALAWEARLPQQWETWREWHNEAQSSTGITRQISRAYTADFGTDRRLGELYEYHLPFYEKLNQHRLRLSTEESI
jgi:hypothetical protein